MNERQIPIARWCEACDVRCESLPCLQENLCGQIKDGTANTGIIERCKERARLFNEAAYRTVAFTQDAKP
jgi:hypothetical protein